jgi:hypothetical protein
MISLNISIVKPVLRGHHWDKEKVAYKTREFVKEDSSHINVYSGQE